MRIISLYQPYATLVVFGAKQFETRSWNTNFRGILGIHATANFPKWCREQCLREPFRSALAEHGFSLQNLPTGAILGTAEVVSTGTSELWLASRMAAPGVIKPEWSNEFYFGDYSAGRYAWQMINPHALDKPIPAKGSQGFWNYDIR